MSDVIARAKAATEGVTAGPWTWGRVTLAGGPDGYEDVLTPGPVECMSYCYGGSSTIEGDNPGPDREFIAAARTLVPDLVALAEKLIAERRAFTGTLGYGDGITQPAATLAEMVDPIKTAFMEAQDHDECPRICEECGEKLAATRCPECHGSGAHGPMSMESAAYVECPHCAGVGWVHDGCAGKTYADLVTLAETQAQQLAAIRELAKGWMRDAGPDSEAWRVFGKQVVSVPFAHEQITAILDGGGH